MPAPITRKPRNRPPRATAAELQVYSPGGRVIASDELELLEELDDTVFAALAGDAEALDRVKSLWRRSRRRAAADALEESRRQYVRRAECVQRCYCCSPREHLAPSFAAAEILELVEDAD